MLYLLKEYDSKDTFGFKDDLERSQCLQWLFFWHGSGQPIEGQLNWFGKLAPEKDEFAINRFKKETFVYLEFWRFTSQANSQASLETI